MSTNLVVQPAVTLDRLCVVCGQSIQVGECVVLGENWQSWAHEACAPGGQVQGESKPGVPLDRIRERYRALLQFVVGYKQTHDGLAPSIREMVAGTDYRSTSAVAGALRRLEAAGFLKVGEGARNVRVVGATWTPPSDLEANANDAGGAAA